MNKDADLGDISRFNRNLFALSEIFHENTKWRRTRNDWVLTDLEHQPLQSELQYALTHNSKVYPSKSRVSLTRNVSSLTMSIEEALRSRRSVREYSGQAIAMDSLSQFLELGYGITGETWWEDGITKLKQRTAPSAGSLYSNEVYIVALSVKDLCPGLYQGQLG